MNLLKCIDDDLWKIKCCVYCYTNLINNKKYIGQVNRTKNDLKQRHRQHIFSSTNENSKDYDTPFHRAIRKYGVDDFKLEVLSITDNYCVDMIERHFIFVYNTINDGYNICEGGHNGNCFAGKNDEEMNEIKRKIRDKATNRLKDKNNHPMYGKHHSEESKRKMSEANKGKCTYKNHANVSGENNPMYGKQHSEESKQKISEAKKGKQLSDEHKQKLSEARKDKPKGELIAQIDTKTYEIINILYNFEYKKNNFSSGHISSCCKHKLKTHKGFIFKYLKECDEEQIKRYIIKNKQFEINKKEGD